MEYGIVIVIAVVVILVRTLTGYAFLKTRTAIRELEAERAELEQSLKQIEEAKLQLERDYARIDRDRGRLELERTRLESEIRVLGGVPVPRPEDPPVSEGTGDVAEIIRTGQSVMTSPTDESADTGETEGAQPPERGDADLDSGQSIQADSVSPEPEAAASGPRILVAEDNAELRQVLESALSRDYSAIVVPDGQAALDLMQGDPQAFDLLITDLRMPNLDGLKLIESIPPGLPFIVISAYLQTDEFRSALEAANPVAVLRKPFKLADLRRAIDLAGLMGAEPAGLSSETSPPEPQGSYEGVAEP